MAHRPRWLTFAAVGLIAAFVFMACTPGAAPTSTPGGTPTGTIAATEPPATEAATTAPGTEAPTTAPGTEAPTGAPTANQYPPEGGVVCASGGQPGSFNGEEYSGSLQLIEATDDQTVVFHLCAPDAAFLQKVAFSVFAINDSDWLAANVPSGAMLETMNGTGPYRMVEWRKGTEIIYSAFEDYWGETAATPNAVLRWAAESASRLTELQATTVHGITNVGPADFDTVENDPNLQLSLPAEGQNLNTFYLGVNHNLEPWSNPQVRQALAVGIDKQRLVDNFYPEGSEVADYFTPCALEFGCEGNPFPDFDPEEAIRLLGEAGFGPGNEITTTLQYRNVIRGYLPLAPQVAQDLQQQLADIGITATIDEQESATFIGNSNTGQLEGIFMLGWGADYPDVTNFLDYHFGAGCTSGFGDCYPEIFEPLSRGNSTVDPEERRAAYTEANNALVEQVPMVPIAHGTFATAYLADVEGAQTSPLSNELLFRMSRPDTDTFVFMQNAEPGTVYCADETDGEALRACEQSMESLYAYQINGTEVIPALAESCEANAEATVWACSLRQGVTFHDGATFDAQDVITSYAAQWDAAHPLHVGSISQFEYWPGLWSDFLNRSAQPEPPA
jgi:peptide/nickel transport system substrate-binding protein